jgi:hypothetical protein
MPRKTRVEIVRNRFPEIIKAIPVAAAKYDKETLEFGLASIKADMQASGSPSAPGQAPGVDTGALINSLQIEMEDEQKGAIVTNDPKAPFLEYGTSKMAARPFLTPASELMRKKQLAAFSGLETDLK